MDRYLFLRKVKQTIYLASLLLLAGIGAAQQRMNSELTKKEKFKWGLSFFVDYMHRDQPNFFTGFAITLQNPKHLFSLGPIVDYTGHGYHRGRHRYEYEGGGAEFCYQFYPWTSKKMVNIYLFANTSFKVYQYIREEAGFKGHLYTYDYTETDLKAAGGLGIRINFTKKFYFYEHNGVGINYNVLKESNYGDKAYYPYGFFQIWAGLGFVFQTKVPS